MKQKKTMSLPFSLSTAIPCSCVSIVVFFVANIPASVQIYAHGRSGTPQIG